MAHTKDIHGDPPATGSAQDDLFEAPVEGDRSSIPSPGTRLDRSYRVVGTIGSGGMGVVLLARDERLDRDVAIKVARGPAAWHEKLRTRFLAEARAIARVRHPNVVAIHAFGEHDGAPFFVMEHVPGESLDVWIAHSLHRGMALEQVVDVLDQLCQGLEAIHGQGLIHGDVKPANVLVGPAFRMVLTDFGLSLPIRDLSNEVETAAAGTPAYMAPERIVGEVSPAQAHRSDIYSLGALAFELLTGRLPFEARHPLKLLHLHREEPRPRPSAYRPGLPAAFDDLVLGAMAVNPEDRFADVAAFRDSLHQAQRSLAPPTERIRVVVAEDDGDFRELEARWLRSAFPEGQVESARDGWEALDLIQQAPLSLAVLDLDMPGLDGIQLTAAIREVEHARTVPILVVTGRGGPPDWRKLRALGADGFLVKPVNRDSLVATARRLVEQAA